MRRMIRRGGNKRKTRKQEGNKDKNSTKIDNYIYMVVQQDRKTKKEDKTKNR